MSCFRRMSDKGCSSPAPSADGGTWSASMSDRESSSSVDQLLTPTSWSALTVSQFSHAASVSFNRMHTMCLRRFRSSAVVAMVVVSSVQHAQKRDVTATVNLLTYKSLYWRRAPRHRLLPLWRCSTTVGVDQRC